MTSARYVTDVPYAAGFHAELAPAWLDLVAVLNGVAPPGPRDDFAWCELGCGPGLAPVVFAATHPAGTFHGIDLLPAHIDRGRAIATAAGVHNVHLHAVDFDAAVGLPLPAFDYIVAHGVYAWVDDEATSALRRFIHQHLAPGGLVYLSYNALPGWAADAPFQHLVRALADRIEGDSPARFVAALDQVRRLLDAGAPALRSSTVLPDLDRQQQHRAPSYFAHEYLAPAWRPRYVDEVRRDLAGIGLAPIGSATLRDNFDRLVLRAAGRAALAGVADPDCRELMRDMLMHQRFRRDVFGRGGTVVDDATRHARLRDATFALVQPPALVRYTMETEAGTVSFDTTTAHRLVSAFAQGPRALHDAATGLDVDDAISTALLLCCAGVLRPVRAVASAVDRLNAVLHEALDARHEPALRVLPHGTALSYDGRVRDAMSSGTPVPDDQRQWLAFIERLG